MSNYKEKLDKEFNLSCTEELLLMRGIGDETKKFKDQKNEVHKKIYEFLTN